MRAEMWGRAFGWRGREMGALREDRLITQYISKLGIHFSVWGSPSGVPSPTVSSVTRAKAMQLMWDMHKRVW